MAEKYMKGHFVCMFVFNHSVIANFLRKSHFICKHFCAYDIEAMHIRRSSLPFSLLLIYYGVKHAFFSRVFHVGTIFFNLYVFFCAVKFSSGFHFFVWDKWGPIQYRLWVLSLETYRGPERKLSKYTLNFLSFRRDTMIVFSLPYNSKD